MGEVETEQLAEAVAVADVGWLPVCAGDGSIERRVGVGKPLRPGSVRASGPDGPAGADDLLLCLPLRFRVVSGRRTAIPCIRGRRESFAGFLCRVEECVQHLESVVR